MRPRAAVLYLAPAIFWLQVATPGCGAGDAGGPADASPLTDSGQPPVRGDSGHSRTDATARTDSAAAKDAPAPKDAVVPEDTGNKKDASVQRDAAVAPSPFSLVVPDGFGVDNHIASVPSSEWDAVESAGFRWIRQDVPWDDVESPKGVYNWAGYGFDGEIAAWEKRGLRGMIIFDFFKMPSFYGTGNPVTAAQRTAFANYAAATVVHYQGRGYLWEILNEPEYSYSSADYAALVKVVGEAVQKVAPDELLVGPALGFKTGTMSDDTVWLEDVFKGGILQYLSAVTLHPYLDQPESVFKLYQSVRSLITKYAPAGKTIPVLSGEWGFQTSTSGGVSEAEQADMVTRIYLTNLYNGVPISIWYDWDDGPTGSALDRYGLVGPPPAMTPKPAYTAASNLAKLLGGYSLERRVNAGNSNTDLILRFSRPGQTGAVFVGWVMQPGQTHTVTIPASEFTGLPTTVPVRGNTGNTLNALTVGSGGLSISISPSPTYFLDR